MGVDTVFADALDVYRLLFRRSVVTAAIVFTIVEALDYLADIPSGTGAKVVLGLVAVVLDFAGPVVVQGALVEIVRNVHEGRRPKSIEHLYESALRRAHSLLWAAIVYALGIVFGLILLVVPGLLAAARWCLMAPIIVLENQRGGDALARSSSLVRGRTGTVLGIVFLTFLIVEITSSLGIGVRFIDLPEPLAFILDVVTGALTAPFEAHVLTVIYYRLTDPERPVIHPDVRTWASVWEGTPA
jgi:hypothetical protein